MVPGSRVMLWANYRRGSSLAVPAPFDDHSSTVWWYDRIAAMAHEWAGIGVTDVLFPNPVKGQSGAYRTGDGYNPFDDYDIGSKVTPAFGGLPTRFGTAEKLRRAVAVCRANGIDVHIDHVMHRRMGGSKGVYRYPGADGRPTSGRFPKDPPCFRGVPPRVHEDPVPAPSDDYAFGDELCPINALPAHYVWNGLLDAGDWLFRTLGVQGARLDDMKGIAVPFIRAFVNHGAMRGKFFFGEYASGNRDDTTWWVNQVDRQLSALDFDFHYNMVQPMCNEAGSGRFVMSGLAGRGMIGIDPMKAVPFVESMDSDTNGFATIVSNKELGYALMLAGEGLPLIYVRDILAEPDCYGLHEPVANLCWINRNLANGGTTPRYGDDKVFIFERSGPPGLLVALNNDVWNPAWRTVTVPTAFGPHVQLHDYTGHNGQDCVTDGDGRATFGVPPGANGRGYGCWSRAGLSGPIEPVAHACEQVFFGAADLDIAPVSTRPTQAGRIWCAAGSTLTSHLSLARQDAHPHTRVTVRAPNGSEAELHADGGDLAYSVRTSGWHVLAVQLTADLPASAYELGVRYTATRTLSEQDF